MLGTMFALRAGAMAEAESDKAFLHVVSWNPATLLC